MRIAIKKITTALTIILSLSACAQKSISEKDWIQLFNGKDLKDWNIKITKHDLDDNFNNTFRVEEGLLKVRYDQYKTFDNQFGHIFYKKPFSAYLLVAEYRFVGEQVPGGPEWAIRNNGLMLHSQSAQSMLKDQDFPISLETQLLGGNGKTPRSTANLCTPGTNVVMNGKLITEHCINSTSKTFAGDQWVTVETLVLGDSIIFNIANGDTVLTYMQPQIGDGNVDNYDSATKQDGKLLKEGYIALQAESAPTDFRKVALFNLEPYINDSQALNKILEQLRRRKKN